MAKPVELNIDAPTGPRCLMVNGEQSELTLSDLLLRNELPLNTRCGQRGLCDGCMIELTSGSLRNVRTGETVVAGVAGQTPVQVRGCDMKVIPRKNVSIRLPARALLAHRAQVLTDFSINVPWAHDPLFTSENTGTTQTGIAGAIDIGTTTVVLALIDLADGDILTRASSFNRQMHLGDDVLTRINLCSTDPTMLEQMQQVVVHETVAKLIIQTFEALGRDIRELAGLSIAGNPTMLHLLMGVDPTPMGAVPFTAAFLDHLTTDAKQITLDQAIDAIPASLPIHLMPSAAAYIGSDVCAGVYASGLIYDEGPSLLIDVGTNGEIVLKHHDQLYACATAAGPAFEGARLTCGTRASDGAISHLHLSTDPTSIDVDIIGDTMPNGICGSAYIDLLGEGRRAGLLSAAGRMQFDDANGFAHYRHEDEYCQGLRIATGQGKHPIVITEIDIASLLQAKAAIAAGVLTLIERAGITPAQLKTVYLAGGFGMHLDLANAVRSGLLPGFDPQQIELVGNTSLAGAYLAAVDRGALAEMSRLTRQIEVIELNLDPDFESRFIDQLSIPG